MFKETFSRMLIWRVTAISLCLNVVLAAWLFIAMRGGRTEQSSVQQNSAVSKLHPKPLSETRSAASATDSAENLLDGFDWGQVESADYRQYISNLRAIGCPENLIGDIILADLAGSFMARARQILDPGPATYWKKERSRPSAKTGKALAELEQEHAAMLKELLGRRLRPQEMIDVLFLQSSRQEPHLAFLSPGRRALAEEALADPGIAENLFDDARFSPEGRKKNLEQKLRALRGVLSEQELREYEKRVAPIAEQVRSDLRFMYTTPEEFQQLVQVRRKLEQNPERDHYAQHRRVVEEVTRALGEERGRDYERSSDLFYQWSREAAARFGVDESAAERAWQIKTETMREAEAIRANKAALLEDRRRTLQELRRGAEKQLRQLLGPDAFALASHGDGVWLLLMAEGIDR